jgi:hypothetical protein
MCNDLQNLKRFHNDLLDGICSALHVLLSIVTNRLMKQTGEYFRGGTIKS